VSHQPERKQKNCLNCGIMVKGRYCQRCGQENIETKQSFGAFAKHFIYDVFHFDGKFFHTLKDLLLKPGKVAQAYVSGKRMHYLDPVRMYLFTSAVFFLVFFAVATANVTGDSRATILLSNNERIGLAHEMVVNRKDSATAFKSYVISKLLDTNLIIILNRDSIHKDSFLNFRGNYYKVKAVTKDEFLKTDESPGSIDRLLKRKARKLALENPNGSAAGPVLVVQDFLHKLPYLLFISLPFFALILKLLYIRRKQFYYSDHIVFTLYHYIFSFFLLFVNLVFKELGLLLHTRIFVVLSIGLCLYWLICLYRGMRNFYRQSREKTVAKFLILNFLGILSLIFLGFIFLLISAIEL
jgi:hypothetical protein